MANDKSSLFTSYCLQSLIGVCTRAFPIQRNFRLG